MFNVGGGEILVILLLALLVLGPDKLPEYARKAGRYMNEFRRLTGGFQEEFRQAMDLGGTASSPSSDPAEPEPSSSSDEDAIHRTTEGPACSRGPTPSRCQPTSSGTSVGSAAGSSSAPTPPDPSRRRRSPPTSPRRRAPARSSSPRPAPPPTTVAIRAAPVRPDPGPWS